MKTNMMKMNILLLDMAVMVSVILVGGAARHVFMKKHQHHHAFELMTSIEEQQTVTHDDEGCVNDIAIEDNENSTISNLLHSQSLTPVPPSSQQQEELHEDEDLDTIKPGSIVELYSDSSYFATPALVLEHSSSSSQQYAVENTITHKVVPTISSKYIHPYQPYPDGTRASCNIFSNEELTQVVNGIQEDQEEVYMTPCVILSHTIRSHSKVVLYQVSYLDGREELVEEIVPFSRVQRIHGRRNGSMLRGVK